MKEKYMVALMLPPELNREVEEVRNCFARKFYCKAASKPPVHITMQPPFLSDKDGESLITKKMEAWAAKQEPLEIQLENFGFFKRNRVVYIKVRADQRLSNLYESLQKETEFLFSGDELQNPVFSPHITIGYRDIPKDRFAEIIAAYSGKPFEGSFVARKIFLWKHTGRFWETLRSFDFTGNG